MNCNSGGKQGVANCDDASNTCPGDDASTDDSLETTCQSPTYVESRTVYTPAVCQPRVAALPDGTTITLSGQACNLLDLLPGGLFASVGFIPDADGVLSFSGCGTAASPFRPAFNYTALAAQILPADTTAYVSEQKCGWQWSGGKLVTRGPLVTAIKSSDSSMTVSYDPADCSFDVKMKTTTVVPVTDKPAEIAIITAQSQVVLGSKVLNVSISNAASGSTGTVTVTPNVGPTPPAQNYTADPSGSAALVFSLDTAATSANVVGSNSSRFLINPQATFAVPC
jgi:hypothetical protein